MSLRDYFAGQALLGLLAGDDPDAPWAMRELPKLAYRLADDMLAARSPREEEPSDDE
jgi:hypothetical protein